MTRMIARPWAKLTLQRPAFVRLLVPLTLPTAMALSMFDPFSDPFFGEPSLTGGLDWSQPQQSSLGSSRRRAAMPADVIETPGARARARATRARCARRCGADARGRRAVSARCLGPWARGDSWLPSPVSQTRL